MKNLYLIGTLPLWLVAGVALAATALVVLQFLNLKQRLSLGQSWFLTLLRAAVYALLLFFLLGPALIDKRVTKLRRPLTVLIDSSQSMAFPASTKANADGKPGPSRLDAVRAKLTEGQDPMIQRLSRDYDLRLFRFGAGLEPMAPNALGQLKAQDQGSRIMEILQSADQGRQRSVGDSPVQRRHRQWQQKRSNRHVIASAGLRHRRRGKRGFHRRAHRGITRSGIRLSRA